MRNVVVVDVPNLVLIYCLVISCVPSILCEVGVSLHGLPSAFWSDQYVNINSGTYASFSLPFCELL